MNHSISTMTGKTKIKIVFLGSQAVGKSSIIEKYIHDRFEETANPTVGIDFLAKNISHKAKSYRLQLWDTAGQERFRSLIPSYLKDANCALIVFDVTSKNSLADIEMWANLFNENKGGEGFIFLVGNKIDLDYREVTEKEGKERAEKLGIPYIQISAKTGQNVEELFLNLIEHTTDRNANSHNLVKKEVIRQEAGKEEEDNAKGLVDETGTKLTANEGEGVVASDNVVLKNEKIGGKADRKKGCC